MIFAVVTEEIAGTEVSRCRGMSSLWGNMVSVKTDIGFVVLAQGGGEDLFSDVTAGVLVWMFICLSQ